MPPNKVLSGQESGDIECIIQVIEIRHRNASVWIATDEELFHSISPSQLAIYPRGPRA